MDDTKRHFGEWMRQRRESLGLSRQQVASETKDYYVEVTIRKIEEGTRNPSTKGAQWLAKALRIPPDKQQIFLAISRGEASVDELGDLASAVELPPPREIALRGSKGNVASARERLQDPLIGREDEVAKVVSLLRPPHVRLLTLTGPPGVGKSSLALGVIASVVDDFPDGVVYVNLAPITDHDSVALAIAEALEIKEVAQIPLDASLQTYLQQKRLLFLLDNFDQVMPAASWIATLCRRVSGVKIVITSRIALECHYEHAYTIEPLGLSAPVAAATRDSVLSSGAGQLFVERAQVVQADFEITDANAPVVAAICDRVSGLPLAIELAAKRIRLFSLGVLLHELSHPFEVLHSDAGGPMRDCHNVLRSTFDLSYRYLEPEEQRLFERLSVFVGGGTVEAIKAVCNATHTSPFDLLNLLERLVAKSLMPRSYEVYGQARFAMLEIIREYALEHLTAQGEAEPIRRQHAAYFLEQATQQERALRTIRQHDALNWFEVEHNNLQEALRWALERHEHTLALCLAGSLWRFWWMHGYIKEGRRWLRETLDKSGAAGEPERVEVLNGASILAHAVGDYLAASALSEQALALAEQVDDTRGKATALSILGMTCVGRGRLDSGIAYLEASERLCRKELCSETPQGDLEGEVWLYTWSLRNLGQAMVVRGDSGKAKVYLEQCVAHCHKLGDLWLRARSLSWLGEVARYQGEAYEKVKNDLEAARRYCRDLGDKLGEAYALLGLGHVAYRQGEFPLARSYQEQRLETEQALGNKQGIAHVQSWLGWLDATEGNYPQAILRLQASRNSYEELGDKRGIALALDFLGVATCRAPTGPADHYEEARAYLAQAMTLREELGDRLGVAHALLGLAEVAYRNGDYKTAIGYHQQRLEVEKGLGNKQGTAHAYAWLGWLEKEKGDYARARELLRTSEEIYKQEPDDKPGRALVECWLGGTAMAENRFDLARDHLCEGLSLYRQAGIRSRIPAVLEQMARLADMQGKPDQAAALFGAAETLRKEAHAPLLPVDQQDYTTSSAHLRREHHGAWVAGQHMKLEQVFDLACSERDTL